MRSHTTLRTAFRFGMMMAVTAGVSFAAASAHADTTTTPAGGDNSSTGSAALKFDYNQGLDTSIDTGYLGPSVAQVRAVIKIDPVTAGGPLYSIDMPKGAVVEASWAGDKKIVLKPVAGAQTDGTDRRNSTFHNAPQRLKLFTGRDDPGDREEQFERLLILLVNADPGGSSVTCFRVGAPDAPVALDDVFDDALSVVADRNPDFYEVRGGRLERV